MSNLNNLKSPANVKKETDSIGSFILDSAIYPMDVDLAFIGKSKGGAMSLTLHMSNGNKSLKTTLWITSGNEKGNKTTYVDRNKNDVHLPGYLIANNLCLLTLGKEIHTLETEVKKVKLYDYDAGKELLKDVDVIVDLIGQKILAGVMKQIVDKNIKNDAGVYVPSGNTKEENEIDKLFRATDGKTVVEIDAKADEAEFIKTWEKKWTGIVKNRSKANKDSGAKAGAPAAAAATSSLFGD